MEKFMNRLETFLTWPDTTLVSSLRLSNCGFFYTGSADTVECYQCHVKVSDWKDDDTPLARHIATSPKCPVALQHQQENTETNVPRYHGSSQNTSSSMGHPHGNGFVNGFEYTPNSSQGRSKEEHCELTPTANSRPNRNNTTAVNHTDPPRGGRFVNSSEYHPILMQQRNSEEGNRTTSTVDYKLTDNRTASFNNNWLSTFPVGVPELVAAGLYYVGPGDRVQCAWCHGRLYQWEEGDSPFGEHAKHFPQCSFVKETMYPTLPESQAEIRSLEQNQHKEPEVQHSALASQIAESMGFQRDLVEKAMQRFPAGSVVTTAELLDILFELEEENLKTDEDSSSEEHGCTENENETGHSSNDDTKELDTLMAENLELNESQQCMVCREDRISVVFLPCRHLVCCDECSQALKHCPVAGCRVLILGTIKSPD